MVFLICCFSLYYFSFLNTQLVEETFRLQWTAVTIYSQLIQKQIHNWLLYLFKNYINSKLHDFRSRQRVVLIYFWIIYRGLSFDNDVSAAGISTIISHFITFSYTSLIRHENDGLRRLLSRYSHLCKRVGSYAMSLFIVDSAVTNTAATAYDQVIFFNHSTWDCDLNAITLSVTLLKEHPLVTNLHKSVKYFVIWP